VRRAFYGLVQRNIQFTIARGEREDNVTQGPSSVRIALAKAVAQEAIILIYQSFAMGSISDASHSKFPRGRVTRMLHCKYAPCATQNAKRFAQRDANLTLPSRHPRGISKNPINRGRPA
jgi:hypothetical protein